jgi:dienelactone hydrolase
VGAVKVFKDLAEGLASNGVMVLRYEKRTKTYPAVTQSRDYSPETEVIEDAALAAGVLRAQPELKPGKLFALGFGFGGYLMPRIAEADGKLAGMAIVNGNERPLEDLALDEAAYRKIQGPQLVLIQEQAGKIKRLTQADVDTAALLGMLGPYLLDLKGYDPIAESKLVAIPMLVLQGGRDFQVNMKDFAAWTSGLKGVKNVTLKSYPTLDHVLVAGAGPSTENDYRKAGQHVAPEVIADLAKWFNQ